MAGNIHPYNYLWGSQLPDPAGDCTKYVQIDGVYVPQAQVHALQVTLEECPSGTTFKPIYGCIENFQCANHKCTSKGSFVNTNDCSSYISLLNRDYKWDNISVL